MSHEEALKFIDDTIKNNPVVVFMKGSPEFPMCGFSGKVVQIFNQLGQKITGVDVLSDDSLREGIKVYTKWPTIPQVFIKGEFVGGCDITSEMAVSGELASLLKAKLS